MSLLAAYNGRQAWVLDEATARDGLLQCVAGVVTVACLHPAVVVKTVHEQLQHSGVAHG